MFSVFDLSLLGLKDKRYHNYIHWDEAVNNFGLSTIKFNTKLSDQFSSALMLIWFIHTLWKSHTNSKPQASDKYTYYVHVTCSFLGEFQTFHEPLILMASFS